MISTEITGKVGSIKGDNPATKTIITIGTGAVANIKDADVKETGEPIAEEDVEVEHPRI